MPTNGATVYYATTDTCILARVYSFSPGSSGFYSDLTLSVTATVDAQSYSDTQIIVLITTTTAITVSFPGASVGTLNGPVTFVLPWESL